MAERLTHEHLVSLEWPFQVGLRAGNCVRRKLSVEGTESQRTFEGTAPRKPVSLNKNAVIDAYNPGAHTSNLRDGADPTY